MNNSTNDTILISIADLKAKDKKAFENLYDKYSGALLNIVLRIVNNQVVAEDILQDSFIKIWKNIDSYDASKATIFTWMLNICKNTSIDTLRKTNSRPTIQTDTENVYVGSLNAVQQNVDLIGVKNSLKYVTTEQRQAIQAVYFSGLTHDEAAKQLGIPLGTIKTRLRTALQKLRSTFH